MGAEKTGRACYSMELQPVYVDVIVTRWQNFTGLEAVLESTGQPWAEVAAERASGTALAGAGAASTSLVAEPA